MKNISELIKELRKRTGIGILDCKNELKNTKGNIDLAIDNMRKKGKIKAFQKSNIITKEGIILIEFSNEKKIASIMEINCETDFVSKSEIFKEFSKKIIKYSIEKKIFDINKLKKKLENDIIELINRTGENINIKRLNYINLSKNDKISMYLHNNKIGVLLSYNNKLENIDKSEFMKHICMHIAANNPKYFTKNDIPNSIIDHEYKIQLNIAKKINKKDYVLKKIIEGRMKKFFEYICLDQQNFLMDNTKKVISLLEENKILINKFYRFELGENI